MNKKLKITALLCMVIVIISVLVSSNAFATDLDLETKPSKPITELTEATEKSTTTTTTTTTNKVEETTKPVESTTKKETTTANTTKAKVLSTVSDTKKINLKEGEVQLINFTISGNVSVRVGNANIISVKKDGTITALKTGSTYIQVFNDNVVQNYQVTVTAKETTTAAEAETVSGTITFIGGVDDETTENYSEEITEFHPTSDRTAKITILLCGILAITIIALIATLIYNRIAKKRFEEEFDFGDAISDDFDPEAVNDNDFYEFEVQDDFFDDELSDEDFDNYIEEDPSFDDFNDPFLQ